MDESQGTQIPSEVPTTEETSPVPVEGKWELDLAVYNVREFEIPDREIEKWPLDKEVSLPLKKLKTEIEVI